jgi:hypothetical protein
MNNGVSFRKLPADVWLACILPRLDSRDVLSLVALNSDTRAFFTTGRLATVLKELGFSDYQSANEWTQYLLSMGVFLAGLDVRSRVHEGLSQGSRKADDHKLVISNQTSTTLTRSLATAAKHPGVAVRHLELSTPYLAGSGLRAAEVKEIAPADIWRHHFRSSFPPTIVNETPFKPMLPWSQLLWPSLVSLRLTGPYGDPGPAFSVDSLQELGRAAPGLTLLELQGLPRVLDVGAWFPRLETFIAQNETSTFREPCNIKGSAALRALQLHRCSAEGVIALISTCPNLVSVDLGRKVRPSEIKVAPTVLPRSVAHFVTNGSVFDIVLVEHQLQSLEVFNCHLCPSLERLVQLSNASIRATVHRVPQILPFGNQVTAHVLSVYVRTPEGFVKQKPVQVLHAHDAVDFSRVPTGVLKKTLSCHACMRLIDETCVADHELVCEHRKQACVMCGAKYDTRAELERHKRVCPHYAGHCHLCFKMVHRSQFSNHYTRDHNDRLELINIADCPNASSGCRFFCHEQNTPKRERHLRLCKSGTIACMSCRQDVPCLEALKRHVCEGMRFVVGMTAVGHCTPLFPNDSGPLEAIPIDGKNWPSWQCFCGNRNSVTAETPYPLRYHCAKCSRAPSLADRKAK